MNPLRHHAAELPSRHGFKGGDHADGFLLENKTLARLNKLLIQLPLNNGQTRPGAIVTARSPDIAHSSYRPVIACNLHGRQALAFPLTTELPRAETGLPATTGRMARVYSVDELLTMRATLPFVICDVDKLNPKITPDVIKVPDELRLSSKGKARSSRDTSSTARMSTSRFSYGPDYSGDSERSHLDVKNGHWSPEEQDEVILFRGNLTSQSHEQKQMWMLRKRGSSDRSSQPFPAPSGFEAQRADNFRKFYAAVISPTHLRVTAGGRVVPNNRVLPNPVFTWNAEQHAFESKERALDPELDRQNSWQPATNPNAAGPRFTPGSVKPVIDEFFGPPMHLKSPDQPAAPADMKEVYSRFTRVSDAHEETGAEDVLTPREGNTAVTQSQVKISPPSQFDVSRPFFLNGQPFYPAPASIQMPSNAPILPFSMLGNLNASYHPLLTPYGMFQQAPLQLPAANFNYTHHLPSESQQIPFMHTPGFPSSSVATQRHVPLDQSFSAESMMLTATAPDEAAAMHPQMTTMVNQIQALQQQLRHLENQLQNNKHQIDEQHVIQQHHRVQSQINTLQSGLNAQLFQPALLPHDQYVPSMWNPGLGAVGVPLASITNLGGIVSKPDGLEIHSVYSNAFQPSFHDRLVHEKKEAGVGGLTSTNGDPKGNKSSGPLPATSGKRLSAAAAMAPEFQPRSPLTTTNQAGFIGVDFPEVTVGINPAILDCSGSQKKVEKKLPSAVASSSKPENCANFDLAHSPTLTSNSQAMRHLTKGHAFNVSSVQYQTPMSHSVLSFTDQKSSPTINGMNPYLMGYPPPGMPPNRVKSTDMVYARALTGEELQARQIYWGKEPRVLSKGLPKFDGKHFYAPSPEKASLGLKEHESPGNDGSSPRSITSITLEPNSLTSVRSKEMLRLRRESKVSQNESESIDINEQPAYETPKDEASYSPGKDAASLGAWGMDQGEEVEIFDQPSCLAPTFECRVSNLDNSDFMKLESSISRPVIDHPAKPSFLKGMLRHTLRTTTAAPTGAVSSTVAHGYLPQYSGFAAASLAPSVGNNNLAPLVHKNVYTGQGGHLFPGLAENRPLQRNSSHQSHVSAAEHLEQTKGLEKETVDNGSILHTKGVGPAYGGLDW